jgi:hypothetical protein
MVAVTSCGRQTPFFSGTGFVALQCPNFLLEDFGTEDHLLDTLDFAYIRIGGFPLTVGNVVAVVMTARWLYAWYFERNPLLKRHGSQIALWFLALPVSTLITMVAFQKNLLTPTQAIKGLLGFGVFFYGMLLSPSWPMGKGYCTDRLLVIMGVTCVLGLFGLCGSNLSFSALPSARAGLCQAACPLKYVVKVLRHLCISQFAELRHHRPARRQYVPLDLDIHGPRNLIGCDRFAFRQAYEFKAIL